MTDVASTIQCRMLCASGCAYGITPQGAYTPPQPYSGAVGWLADPVPIFGGTNNINACLVGVNGVDGIIIAFRGTLPPVPVTVPGLIDWWQDVFEVKPETENNLPGKVHHGFWNAIESIWPQVAAHVAALKRQYPQARLHITGHSKGGPMATLAAARMHFDMPTALQPAGVYTFASPHPGDTDFVAGFPLSTIPVTRFENYLDIVPFLPPTEAFIELAARIPLIGELFKEAEGWDYASLGTLQYIQEDHQIIGDNPLLEPLRLAELVTAMVQGESGFEKIAAAHSHLCGGGYMGGTCPTGVCPI